MMHNDIKILVFHDRIAILSDLDRLDNLLVNAMQIHRKQEHILALLRDDLLRNLHLVPSVLL